MLQHFRAGVGDVELDLADTGQRPGVVVVVDSDAESVYPGLAISRLGAALRYREADEVAGVDVEVGAQGVQPGGRKPLFGPLGQIALGGLLLQRCQQEPRVGRNGDVNRDAAVGPAPSR